MIYLLVLFIICVLYREKRDLKLALELAEHIAKKKNAHELSLKTPTPVENVRQGILKKSSQPNQVNRYVIKSDKQLIIEVFFCL